MLEHNNILVLFYELKIIYLGTLKKQSSMFFFYVFFRNISLQITMNDYQDDESGAFDVTVSTIVEESQLTRSTVFYCNLVLPSTPYQITKKFVYIAGKKSI